MKRTLTLAAATIIAGILTYNIADGILRLLATCSPWPGGTYPYFHCTQPGDAPVAFGFIGALAGFWFAYTGRLTRLFGKV
jgi:hypothetical protein